MLILMAINEFSPAREPLAKLVQHYATLRVA